MCCSAVVAGVEMPWVGGKQAERERFAKLDSSVTGKGAATVYRDRQGRVVDVEELKRQQEADRKPKHEAPTWGAGLKQVCPHAFLCPAWLGAQVLQAWASWSDPCFLDWPPLPCLYNADTYLLSHCSSLGCLTSSVYFYFLCSLFPCTSQYERISTPRFSARA